MRKDFDLILSKAADLHVEMPATVAAGERNAAEAAPGTEDDFSAVIRLLEELSDRHTAIH
jgi:3-hydroxyisobutyrate dehydrogenase-like beta-hydroxyacid dehydrogenase